MIILGRLTVKQFPSILQHNTIQILLSTPHGGFSETSVNSTGNQKKKKKKKVSQNDYQLTVKKLFTYKFMTSKIDLKGRLSFYV